MKILLLIFSLILYSNISYANISTKGYFDNSEKIEYYNEKAIELETSGNLDEAELFYLKSLELDIENPNILFNLGHLYLKKNNPEKAKHCFEILVEVNPKDWESLNLLGIALSGTKEYKEAIHCWKRSLLLNNTQVELPLMIKELEDKFTIRE